MKPYAYDEYSKEGIGVHFAEIAEICRRARKNCDCTQDDVAKYIGCGSTAVMAFEKSKTFSGRILMWYLSNLLTEKEREEVIRLGKDEKFANRYEEIYTIWRKKA